MVSAKHTCWQIITLMLVAFASCLSTRPAAAQAERCFPQTGQCITGRFRAYWEQNGGLAIFGYPISAATVERNPDTGREHLTQWFERNRFELHTENDAPYDVLLGRLGDDALSREGLRWQDFMDTQQEQDCLYFPETRQSLCDTIAPFKSYWESHGLLDPALNAYQRSLALFGMPLSSPQPETNAAGDTVVTQWFERARFEWHPGNPAEFRVLLGLLGDELRAAPAGGPRTLPADAVWVKSMEKVRALAPSAPYVTLSKGQGLDHVAAAPDGSLVVYFQHSVGSQPGGKLWGLNVRTGQRRVVYDVPGTMFGIRFSPDSSRLAVVVGDMLEMWQLMDLDLRTGQSRVLQRSSEQSFLVPLAWTSAGILGTRVSYGDAPPRDLLLIDPATGTMRALRRGDHWGGAISDDGMRLAVITGNIGFGGTPPELTLTVIATDTGRQTVVVSKAKQGLSLVGWSPDGARLAYRSFESNQSDTLHVVNPDGSNRQSLVFPHNGATGQLMDTRWRDRSTLVVLTALGKQSRVYQAPLNAFTIASLQLIGATTGGMEAPEYLLYVPRP